MTLVCPSKFLFCNELLLKNDSTDRKLWNDSTSTNYQQQIHLSSLQRHGKEKASSFVKNISLISSKVRVEFESNLEDFFGSSCSVSEFRKIGKLRRKKNKIGNTKTQASTSYPPFRTAHPDGNLPPVPPFVDSQAGSQVDYVAREVEDGAEVLIECRDVYKSFGDKHILRGASFKIRAGEAVGIIGPSGTGKSTVLRIMAGLLAPDSGEVIVCGKARQGLISDESNPNLRIGLVFQSAALFDSLTVRENVGFMLYEHTDLSEIEIREQVSDSLAAVGLKGVEERLPSELSGGMKKRVALARAIISDGKPRPKEREVVMYDEPTAGLDPIASTVVEDLIRSLHIRENPDGTQVGKIASYVVVTHQHSTIRRAVDRLLFLHEGKVVWEGPTTDFDTTDNPIVRQFADGSLNGPIKY